MSGGSYNYLAERDTRSIIEDPVLLRAMALDLANNMQRFHADDINGDLLDAVALIDRFVTEVDAKLAPLRPVMHAIEWRVSCDWSDDQVFEAFAEYRANRDGSTNRTRLVAKPVIVCHLEDPPGSGLAACCGLPFDTPTYEDGRRYGMVLCTGCAKAGP